MKLLDYISQSQCDEVVVHDTVYDIELYFYGSDSSDQWNDAVNRIAAELEVTDVEDEGIVTVALSELIIYKMEQLRFLDLFKSYGIADIHGRYDEHLRRIRFRCMDEQLCRRFDRGMR